MANDSTFSLLNLPEIENWGYKLANWWTGNTMELPVLYRLLLLLHSFALFFFFFLSFLIWTYFPFLLFSSTFFHYFTLSPSIPSSVSLYFFSRSSLSSFLIFVLLFFFPTFMLLLPFPFTLPIRQDSSSAIFRTITTPNTVLRAPLCGSSKPSPRSGQSQIQADYSLHLVLGPILCGTLSPMIPARLHDTAVNPTRNFVTCLSPLCFTLRRCQQSRVYSGRL